ncbi:MAG: sugar ABC transporter permease [Chloroflexi bacterium]|uniref:carbohydrate ABC transporter permease n=1 Tax=Candidatus Flexifilum breve TaxID=3140694 RepID=UPI0031362DEC|nr:sugar ABC transporter permease [Chloroflexota bacterium]
MAGTVSVSLRKSLFARLLPYLLIAPTLILVFIFTVYPAINSVVDSLYKPARNARDPSEYVGLENYVDLFNPDHYIGSAFVQIIGQTLTFSIVTVLVSVPLALLFALLLNRKMPLQGVWRFSLFYPSLLPLIGAASIWAFLFSDTVGLINTVVRSFGGRGANWIGDPNISLWAVIVVNIWKQVGYYMIFYLAGLQGISRDFYEAAELDGANGWQQFYYLTLPLLRRTTLFILVIAFTFAFQTVEQLQVLGMGGPGNSSNLLLFYIFQTIPERRNWGYVNAMSVVLVLILLVFTVSNFALFERGREDD